MKMKQYLDVAFIKFLMEKRGLSVKDMAAAMDVTPQTVRRYLAGGDQIPLISDIIFRFAKALKVPVVELIRQVYC